MRCVWRVACFQDRMGVYLMPHPSAALGGRGKGGSVTQYLRERAEFYLAVKSDFSTALEDAEVAQGANLGSVLRGGYRERRRRISSQSASYS